MMWTPPGPRLRVTFAVADDAQAEHIAVLLAALGYDPARTPGDGEQVSPVEEVERG